MKLDIFLRNDEVPENGTHLRKELKDNPKLLVGKVCQSFHPAFSVIFLAISLGSLNLADCILKPEGNQFGLNVDPFYLAKDCLNLDALPESAGINFYFALITLQYHSQKNKLSELIIKTEPDNVIINQTYYDKLYWENENNEVFYTSKQPNTTERHVFMHAQAEWFMQLSYEVFQLEEQLKKLLQEAETQWNKFSNWLLPHNPKPIQEIYAKLADHYLHIAYMEISSENAFFYFIKKANDYFARSSNDYLNIHNKLSKLIASDRSNLWRQVQYEPLKDRGIATRDHSIDAAEAWSKAFNFAHRKIIDQDIPSSLHFMETDSARTSSTERNSHSSDELQKESHITNAGLHRRCKGSRDSNVTANPLLNKSTI